MLRIGICDDITICREEIRSFCIKWAKENDLVIDIVCLKSAKDLLDFCDEIELAFDIIFMDIELGESINGIDAVKKINRLNPYCKIIYVTGYSDYATDVYETEHSYLVLKNNDIAANATKALDRAYESLKRERQEEITVRAKGLRLIKVKDIICLERDGRATVIRTKNDMVKTYETFDDIQGKIKTHGLKRCHKSYAVNFYHVVKYNKANFLMDNKQTVPISRKYQKEIFDCFSDYIESVVISPSARIESAETS